MNVSLTAELEKFIEQQVQTGLYSSASEVMRHALRLMVEQEVEKQVKLSRMRHLVEEGVESGQWESWNAQSFLERLKGSK